MREVKFRAWDYNHQTMKEVKAIDWMQRQVVVMPYSNESSIRLGVQRWFDQVALMRYTGFKDQHGVEIYEGDICKYWMDSKWKTGYIIWHRGGFAIKVFKCGDEPVDWLFEFQCFIPAPREGNTMGDQFQVIGNVYENPELAEAMI